MPENKHKQNYTQIATDWQKKNKKKAKKQKCQTYSLTVCPVILVWVSGRE